MDTLSALLLLQRISPTFTTTYWRLLEHFPDLPSALAAPDHLLHPLLTGAAIEQYRAYQRDPVNSQIAQQIQADLGWCEQHDVSLLHLDHADYPQLLREIPKAPPLLYLRGRKAALHLPQLAVVGTRNPTPGGAKNAQLFTKTLAESGLAITSGLALGIDQLAHEACLNAQGCTLAVMATGVDQIYPKRHQALAERILAEGGALISEFPLGTAPLAGHFPQRNRIISGLSAGVLVVEAAVKSGSLITARYALSQNREVFALPGSIHNPLSRGCHALIKDGAALVEATEDILNHLQGYLALKWQQLDLLNPPPNPQTKAPTATLSRQEQALLLHLGYDPTGLDELTERSGMPMGTLLAALTELEMQGLVACQGTDYSRL
jgi:DNA processing protein